MRETANHAQAAQQQLLDRLWQTKSSLSKSLEKTFRTSFLAENFVSNFFFPSNFFCSRPRPDFVLKPTLNRERKIVQCVVVYEATHLSFTLRYLQLPQSEDYITRSTWEL